MNTNRIETLLNQEFDWSNKEAIGMLYKQIFCWVDHSMTLLTLGYSRAKKQSDLNYFLEQIGDEAHHEKLIKADLTRLGYKLDDFKELPATRMMYEAQYYKVEHQSIYSMMGYIYFLEDLAVKVCTKIATKLHENFGIKSAFIDEHGEADISHVGKVKKILEEKSGQEKQWIDESIEQSIYAMENILEEIIYRSESKKIPTAA